LIIIIIIIIIHKTHTFHMLHVQFSTFQLHTTRYRYLFFTPEFGHKQVE